MSNMPAGYVNLRVEDVFQLSEEFIKRRIAFRARKREEWIQKKTNPPKEFETKRRFGFFGDEIKVDVTPAAMTRAEAEDAYTNKPKYYVQYGMYSLHSQERHDHDYGARTSEKMEELHNAAVFAQNTGVKTILVSTDTLERVQLAFTK